MLGGIGVCAGNQHAPVGVLAAAGPHFLTSDYVLVAIALGLGAEPRQVRAGPRFAKELAPRISAVENSWNVLGLLFGRTVRGDGRRGQHEAEAHWRANHTSPRQGAVYCQSDIARVASPTHRRWQHRRRVTAGSQPLPPFGNRDCWVPGRI